MNILLYIVYLALVVVVSRLLSFFSPFGINVLAIFVCYWGASFFAVQFSVNQEKKANELYNMSDPYERILGTELTYTKADSAAHHHILALQAMFINIPDSGFIYVLGYVLSIVLLYICDSGCVQANQQRQYERYEREQMYPLLRATPYKPHTRWSQLCFIAYIIGLACYLLGVLLGK